MKRSTFVRTLLCAFAFITAFSGCASSSNKQYFSDDATESVSIMQYDMDMEAAETEAVADGSSMDVSLMMSGDELGSIVDPADSNRKIIYYVDMSLETMEFDKSLLGLNEAVQKAGGYIESSSVSGTSIYDEGYGRRFASLVVRIPPDTLDSFIEAVNGICNVTNSSQSKEDVTTAYTDVETRKKTLEVEQERLLALLEQADSIETIVALESRLSEVRYQLESFSSQLRSYDERVDYSTVTLNLDEVRRISDPAPRTMGERIKIGFSDTLYSIRDGIQDITVWIIVNLPYLLIWAVILVVFVLFVRRTFRRVSQRRSFSAGNADAPQRENFYQSAPEDKKEEK